MPLLNPSVDPRDTARLSKQCALLLEYLRRRPITNVEAAVDLRVLNLTARISELRQAGHDITATRGAGGVWTYKLNEERGQMAFDVFSGSKRVGKRIG